MRDTIAWNKACGEQKKRLDAVKLPKVSIVKEAWVPAGERFTQEKLKSIVDNLVKHADGLKKYKSIAVTGYVQAPPVSVSDGMLILHAGGDVKMIDWSKLP